MSYMKQDTDFRPVRFRWGGKETTDTRPFFYAVYEGFFVREIGSDCDLIAVTPEIRAQICADLFYPLADPTEEKPVETNGLILLDNLYLKAIRRGRPHREGSSVRISLDLEAAELAAIDAARGAESRASFLRRAAAKLAR